VKIKAQADDDQRIEGDNTVIHGVQKLHKGLLILLLWRDEWTGSHDMQGDLSRRPK
jgi:hypothetical protein